MQGNPLQAALRLLSAGAPIDSATLTAAFDAVMRGEATAAQTAALLMGLRVRGETPEEVAAVARALRSAMVALPTEDPDALVDTCGTGGGSVTTFNISTAAALLAAGAGVRIAKHGNRSFTSKCGSADVLEALGVAIDVQPPIMQRALSEAGIVFMFAPLMHPAMKHVGPVRRELAIPTVMNIVGPLANPASAGRQVVGVAEEARMPLIAGALASLGTVRAMVVHGAPGMDEVSPMGPTKVIEVRDGAMTHWTIDPAEFGFAPATADELGGGDPAENASIIIALLGGGGPAGARSAVVLNAAAAIHVSGRTAAFGQAVEMARAALAEGKGMLALDRLRTAYAPGIARGATTV